MRTQRSTRFAVIAAVLLVGCATPARENAGEPAPFWPAAPEPPRIAFVKTFSSPEDLGIRKGLFQRLRNFVFGEEETRMVRPTAVVEAGNVLYVADPGVKGVHRFDTRRSKYRLIRGQQDSPLPSPVGLARGARGEIYVSDSKLAQVMVIQPGAGSATPLQLQGDLLQPTGLAFDASTRQLYVVDTGAHQIHVYDSNGHLVRSIGGRGVNPGQFNYPTLLWLSSEGHLYVTDTLNFRVQILDRKGKFVGMFGQAGDATGDAARQKGVATDQQGHVYVVDSLFHAVQIFGRDGRYLLTVGAQGQGRGEFWLPVGIYIDSHDAIYVTDTFNRRVQVFRYLDSES